MSKKVLGIFKARRFVFSIPPYVSELLLFSQDRVVVIRRVSKPSFLAASPHTEKSAILAEFLKTMDVGNILRSDKHNFAIPNSEITKVELKKSYIDMDTWLDFSILTSKQRYKWNALNLPQKKDAELRDYEGILRPIFGDRLAVRSAAEMKQPLDWP